jgi:hypothetical protein
MNKRLGLIMSSAVSMAFIVDSATANTVDLTTAGSCGAINGSQGSPLGSLFYCFEVPH